MEGAPFSPKPESRRNFPGGSHYTLRHMHTVFFKGSISFSKSLLLSFFLFFLLHSLFTSPSRLWGAGKMILIACKAYCSKGRISSQCRPWKYTHNSFPHPPFHHRLRSIMDYTYVMNSLAVTTEITLVLR